MTRGWLAFFVLLAPLCGAQEPDAALLARARAILDRAPLIDTHNDLAEMLIEKRDGDIAGLDLGVLQPEWCADIPRLRQGGVGAQYWSVYTSVSNMKQDHSLHEALREEELLKIAGRNHLRAMRRMEAVSSSAWGPGTAAAASRGRRPHG